MKTKSISDRVLRMQQLTQKVGYAPPTIYALVAQGKFPPPFKLVEGGRAAGWMESTIDSWLEERARSGSARSTKETAL